MSTAMTVRDALRQATDPIHARLHGLPALRDLAEGRIDHGGYVALLRRLLGFHAAAEAALAAAPSLAPWDVDLMERRRAWLIEADLAALGDPVSPVASRPAEPGPAESRLTEPRPAEPGLVERAPLPRLDTAARALGCLYVTEGSTLGGQQLARALDGILPPGPTGRRFLLGHGARHGAMWRGCCAALERCGADPAERAAMLDAAAETFAAFEAWFAPAAGAAKRGVALPPRPE